MNFAGHKIRKKAVVLGGSSGIGKAIAQRFASEGYKVLIASADYKQCLDVIENLQGNKHFAVEVDVRSIEQINMLAAKVKDYFGTFEVLVNSIGISKGCGVLNSDFDYWNDSLDVMLYGTVKSCKVLLPLMEDGGRVIHITSIHHERVENGSSSYGMAKAAITQFTRSLAIELVNRNILANTIAPGFIETPMSVKANGVNELESEWFKDNYIKYNHLPLKRPGRPEEIAGIAYFLAGPDATYITGSVITADGGLTITF